LMAYFRKKPIVVEVHRFDGSPESGEAIARWVGGAVYVQDFNNIIIPTLEGNKVADKGDFVIKGVKGEFYPCKPDIFFATYDMVEDNNG